MCPKLIELLSWNGPTVHVCCFMLARACTKTFVSRVQKTAKKIFVSRKNRQQVHSLAEVSMYIHTHTVQQANVSRCLYMLQAVCQTEIVVLSQALLSVYCRTEWCFHNGLNCVLATGRVTVATNIMARKHTGFLRLAKNLALTKEQVPKIFALLGCYATKVGTYRRFGTTYRSP